MVKIWSLHICRDLKLREENTKAEKAEMAKDHNPSKMPHVVAVPFPGEGHINPLLHFCQRLVSKGVRVTLVIANFNAKSVQKQDTELFKTQYISCGFNEGEIAESTVAYFKRLYAAMSDDLISLIEKLKSSEYPPKVLIYDSTVTWALEVALQFGLLGASFFTESCSVSALYYHLHQGTLRLPPPGQSSVSVPPLPLLELRDLPCFDTVMDPNDTIRKFFSGQFSNVEKANWILFNTFDKLEMEVANWMASKWPTFKTIGPTIMKNNKNHGTFLLEMDSEACLKWLDKRDFRSVVYVSVGSVAILGQEQMEEIAKGLINSNCYFLWMVRASEESKLPANFKSETSEKGLIINWCPQLEVLEHQAVACFMTHCGWNSTLEALSSGVPVIAIPQMIDQMTNAKFLEDVWQSGVRVQANDRGIVTREVIEMRIREVTQGERADELRRNAEKWKDLVQEATAEGGSSHNNICDFVSELSSI